MFITFEGTDGSGKSTQARETLAALREQGYPVLLTREPGGTDISDQVRGILLDNLNNTEMAPTTELLLFCASRAQLVEQLIRPMLAKQHIVLCDRYADSTLAYQGYGHGLDIKTLKRILDFATGGLKPDLTVYLNLDPKTGLERRKKGVLFGEDWNRLDNMQIEFHKRVYKGYQKLIKADPQRWLIVDAAQSQEAVFNDIMAGLAQRLPQLQ